MQAATERRDPVATRVPLDDVLINLSPEGYHETFAADGVNVGVGGVSIRSAILPDVGAKLHCRFQSPHDGHAVDADCEVVWSHASGSNVGEFGMRFTGMTTDDQASIEELVEAWNHDLLADVEPVQAAEPPQSLSVKLHLDGVGSPIEAEAMHRADDALVVEQSLPFLRIGTGVSEGNRRGTLQSVDLRIEDDLPRLVMTVCYEDEQATDEKAATGDETLLEGEAPQSVVDVHSARADASVSLPNDGPSTPLELESALPEKAEAREAVVELRYDASNEEAIESEAPAADDDESLVAQLKPDFRRSLRAFGARLAPLWARVRALGLALWIKAGPRARALGARTKTFASLLGKKAGASVGTLRARITKRSTTQVKTSKRTAAPKRTKQGDGPAAPKRGIGRYILGGVVVLLALGYFVSQLSAETPMVLKSEAAPEPAVDPEAGDETFATPEPIEAAVAPSAAPGEVPAASPYASESTATDVESAEKFESGDVGGGRSYTLRMSLPPRGMRGQDTEDGIRVVILGSNAIDGARRIASADPRISSASILNHGEEAELRLRFTEGDRPGYRIESRSSTLVITIGD